MKNITALFLLILSVALFFTFTNPYYKKVETLRASALDYRNVLDNLSLVAERRDQLLVNYEEIPKAEIERLKKILPDNVDTVKMAQELDTIASRYGIAIKNVRIDKSSGQNVAQPVLPEFEKPFDRTVLSFTFISNYSNFRRFLEDLERSLRIMDVRSLVFQNSASTLSEYHISIETYWLKSMVSSAEENLVKTAEELSSINFDRQLFAAPAYRFLTDFSSAFPQEPLGRSNPFDIIGRD
ncbi:MAG: hypothetical protein Q7S54_00280 [bacterium]|nr:hypothetical protein [bacterium]